MSDSVWPHRQQPTRLLHPWDFPGKSIGAGCHCLLSCHNKNTTEGETGRLRQQKFIFYISGVKEVQYPGLARYISFWNPLLFSFWVASLWLCVHMTSLLTHEKREKTNFLVSLFTRTLIFSDKTPFLTFLFYLNYFFRGSISSYNQWGLETQHMNFGETQSFIYIQWIHMFIYKYMHIYIT